MRLLFPLHVTVSRCNETFKRNKFMMMQCIVHDIQIYKKKFKATSTTPMRPKCSQVALPTKGNNKRQKGILSYILGFNFDSNFSKPLSMSSSRSI